MNHPLDGIAHRLNSLLAEAGQPPLAPAAVSQFESYFELLQRWNERINLTAIRNEDEILRRHFVESIVVARSLPTAIRTLLDLGSGAGFPGLPIAICRPEIAVMLAESQNKKAGFLREAARTLAIPVEVYSARAENLARRFDCVTLRAVDRMEKAVQTSAGLLGAGGWLALLTTISGSVALTTAAGPGFSWQPAVSLPSADSRLLLLGRPVK